MTNRRDTVVIGASSGGVRALRMLLSRLPQDLPAAVFVVQHQAAISGQLAAVLRAASKLPVLLVDREQRINQGQVYVAPPDAHMVIAGDTVLSTRGPEENRSRPSINVLFRTAAAERGSRVISVQLTGMLDDGVAGLDAVKRCGGLVVVQDPEDAEFDEMPRHALEAVEADHVMSLDAIPALLARLVLETAPPTTIPQDVAIEARLSGPARSTAGKVDAIGEHVSFACPDCGGPLWKVGAGGAAVYRCHVGHAMSARVLLGSQAQEIERSMWAAVRSLADRAATLNKLAESVEARNPRAAQGFRTRAAETTSHSEQARQFLLSLRMTRPGADAGVNVGADDTAQTQS